MHADRIRKIAFFLRNDVKDQFFNLATWAGNDEKPWLGHPDLSCGTSACAMGHATTIPEFAELGLHLEKDHPEGDRAHLVFGVHRHFKAAAVFLDITENEAEYLFNPDKYPEEEDTTRLEVCARLEDFLSNGIPDEAYEEEMDDEDEEEDEEW